MDTKSGCTHDCISVSFTFTCNVRIQKAKISANQLHSSCICCLEGRKNNFKRWGVYESTARGPSVESSSESAVRRDQQPGLGACGLECKLLKYSNPNSCCGLLGPTLSYRSFWVNINHFFFLNNNVPLSLHSYRTAERWLIWNMINLFLLTGYIPQAFEVVTIKPLLKKALPDPAV